MAANLNFGISRFLRLTKEKCRELKLGLTNPFIIDSNLIYQIKLKPCNLQSTFNVKDQLFNQIKSLQKQKIVKINKTKINSKWRDSCRRGTLLFLEKRREPHG